MSIGDALGGALSYLRSGLGLGDDSGGLSGSDFRQYAEKRLPSYGAGTSVPQYGGSAGQGLPAYGSGAGFPNYGAGTQDVDWGGHAMEAQQAQYRLQNPTKPGQNTGPGSSPLPGPAPSPAPGGLFGLSPDVARWDNAAKAATAGTEIDPDVLLALMTNESQGVPTARNADAGALGLLQLLPDNFQPGENWADPETNLKVGVRLMQQKIAAIKRTYAANGISRTGKAFWTDVAQAWLGTFDYDTGGWTSAVDANGFGAQDQARVFGANYDKVKAARQQAPAPSGGGAGFSSLWGGANAPITQEFGHTDFAAANSGIYDYETQFGLTPGQHTGVDVGVKRGSQLFMPAGLSGTVIERAPGFYRDEDYGDDGQSYARGELRIALDNGAQLILGHNSQISVRPGQRVTAGQLLALSGSANGDHVHVEVRVPDRSTPSGWRIVGPQEYFASLAGGNGGTR